MKDQKNIERLFQEKFKDFEAIPPQGSWDAIASRLNEKKKKKRMVPFWFQLSGIAASLVIIGTLIWNFQSEGNTIPFDNSNETIVDVENEKNNSEKSSLNSKNNRDFNLNEDLSIEKKTNESKTENSTFDSNYLNSRKSNTTVSNQNQNTHSSDKNNKVNSSITSKDKKNSTKTRFDINLEESNTNIVATSRKSKVNSDKSTKESLITDSYVFLSDDGNNNTNKWVETKDQKDKTNPNEKIISNKIDSFFETNQNNTNCVNTISDSLTKKHTDTTTVVLALSEKIINNDSTLVAEISPETNPLEELLKEKEAGKNEDEKEKEKRSRWAVSTNASPVYFNSMAKGSSLDSRFDANQKEYNNTLSYGIGINYAINKKWTIKTGINNLDFDYNTNEVAFYQDISAKPIQNVNTNSMGKMINVESKLVDNGKYVSVSGNALSKFDGSINQQFSFIEVPLELGYKVLDRKFGIELIGGLSTLFLNDNSVSIVSNGQEMVIGKANNLNDIHFSSNVGLGFKYTFWKSFNANFQPMFKYQINPFSENAGNFKPYFIGLYSGISYQF